MVISLIRMLALTSWIYLCNQRQTSTHLVEWCIRSYPLDVSPNQSNALLSLTLIHTGDTTTYNTSWFMMEIHHKRNQHLNALYRIRAEIEDHGFTDGFLTYTDAPVSWGSRPSMHSQVPCANL